MRTSYRICKFCGDAHDVNNWPDNHREWVPDNRSDLASPFVIGDNIELLNHATGEMATSKRALRQSYRDNGMIEVGTTDCGLLR